MKTFTLRKVVGRAVPYFGIIIIVFLAGSCSKDRTEEKREKNELIHKIKSYAHSGVDYKSITLTSQAQDAISEHTLIFVKNPSIQDALNITDTSSIYVENTKLKSYYEYLKSMNADVPKTFSSFHNTLLEDHNAENYHKYALKNNFRANADIKIWREEIGLYQAKAFYIKGSSKNRFLWCISTNGVSESQIKEADYLYFFPTKTWMPSQDDRPSHIIDSDIPIVECEINRIGDIGIPDSTISRFDLYSLLPPHEITDSDYEK